MCVRVMCVYLFALYSIVFIILIDIQEKICSCTIFHIDYLRNINQFVIRMLLFRLNNEISLLCSNIFSCLNRFLFVTVWVLRSTHTQAFKLWNDCVWVRIRIYPVNCHNMVALFPVARTIDCLLRHKRMSFTVLQR